MGCSVSTRSVVALAGARRTRSNRLTVFADAADANARARRAVRRAGVRMVGSGVRPAVVSVEAKNKARGVVSRGESGAGRSRCVGQASGERAGAVGVRVERGFSFNFSVDRRPRLHFDSWQFLWRPRGSRGQRRRAAAPARCESNRIIFALTTLVPLVSE